MLLVGFLRLRALLPLTSLGAPTKQLWIRIPNMINRGLINGAGFVPFVIAVAAPETPHGEPFRVTSVN